MNCLRRALARAAICSLALISHAFCQAALAQQTPAAAGQTAASFPRPNPDTLVLTVTVLDRRGAFVEGLEKSHFTVFDDKTPREITFFKGTADEPASVGILLDTSGSMKASQTQKIGEALARFIREGNTENDYFLLGFNERPELLADWTRDGQEILSRITDIKPQSATALYDACRLGVEKIMRAPRPRRVLLLITDGTDTVSDFSRKELTKLLQESDVTLYAVGILGGRDPGAVMGMAGQRDLERLSEVTGGAVHFPNSVNELDKDFGRLAYELRHQYRLGFKPADEAHDGEWHKIKVKVTVPPGAAPPGLKISRVRTREGYYATRNPR